MSKDMSRVKVIKTFKYRIYPNQKTKKTINETIRLCKNLYNIALEQRISCYKQFEKSINYNHQQNELPDLKNEFPEYKEVYSQVLQDVLRRLDKSFDGFFRRVKSGGQAGFPRFQSSKRYNSFTYAQSGYSVTNNWLELSKIGKARVFFHRTIMGKVKTCTIVRKNGRYYVCFSCEVEAEQLPLTGRSVGIDMGLKDFSITSDGQVFENPRNYRKSEKELKRQQRSVSRKKKGSNRRRKSVMILARKHEHVSNKRLDNAFKVAHELVSDYDTIIREDLQIKNMVKNGHLSKSISDAGWGIFFNVLESKAKQTLGKQVIAVDPRNTSKKCSSCGEMVPKKLSDRVHVCPKCGLILDRDVNAAINILRLGLSRQGLGPTAA